MIKFFQLIVACVVAFPAYAGQNLPPFTEAVLPIGPDLYAIAIGPGGPGTEFGSDEKNGGLYKITKDSKPDVVELSDGMGLRNPTGMVELDGQIVLVDGSQVISTSTDGKVNWRTSLNEDGVFFYDIEVLDETTLIVSDFGRGAFASVNAKSGEIKPYLAEIHIGGLARFEIAKEGILAASWGADDAWDSALYLVSQTQGTASAKMLTDGFGNLESVEVVDGNVVVGGYRGHKKFQNAKLLKVALDGTVQPLSAGSNTKGASDILSIGTSVWLTYFYDASFEMLPAGTIVGVE